MDQRIKPSTKVLSALSSAAINPIDCHMQDHGVFVQQWPPIFGCDVAGEVYEVGLEVQRFKKGDGVIG